MQRRESPPCHRRCECTIVKGYHREATVSGADCAATTGRVCVGSPLSYRHRPGSTYCREGQVEDWSSSGWVAQRRQRNQQTYIISKDEQLMLDSAAVAKICWDSQQRGSVGRFADTETIDKAIIQTHLCSQRSMPIRHLPATAYHVGA